MAKAGSFAKGNKLATRANTPQIRQLNKMLTSAAVHYLTSTCDDPEFKGKLAVTNEEVRNKRRIVDLMVKNVCIAAIGGDMVAVKYLWERIEGRMPEHVDLTLLKGDTEVDEEKKLRKMHEDVKGKSVEQLTALYRETLGPSSPTNGSA